METKSCNLTENETKYLLEWHGNRLSWPDVKIEEEVERINYLNKRLKAFNEPEEKAAKPVETPAPQGWGNSNG